jgi:hypothetical protein
MLQTLPDNVLAFILGFVDAQSILNTQQTCKDLHTTITTFEKEVHSPLWHIVENHRFLKWKGKVDDHILWNIGRYVEFIEDTMTDDDGFYMDDPYGISVVDEFFHSDTIEYSIDSKEHMGDDIREQLFRTNDYTNARERQFRYKYRVGESSMHVHCVVMPYVRGARVQWCFSGLHVYIVCSGYMSFEESLRYTITKQRYGRHDSAREEFCMFKSWILGVIGLESLRGTEFLFDPFADAIPT